MLCDRVSESESRESSSAGGSAVSARAAALPRSSLRLSVSVCRPAWSAPPPSRLSPAPADPRRPRARSSPPSCAPPPGSSSAPPALAHLPHRRTAHTCPPRRRPCRSLPSTPLVRPPPSGLTRALLLISPHPHLDSCNRALADGFGTFVRAQAGDQDRLARVPQRVHPARARDHEGHRGRRRGADCASPSLSWLCSRRRRCCGMIRVQQVQAGGTGRGGRARRCRRLQEEVLEPDGAQRTDPVPRPRARQQEQAFRNFQAVLKESGCQLTDVAKTTVFLQSLGDFAAVRRPSLLL